MAQIKYITKNAPDSGYVKKYHDDNAIRDEIQYIFDVKHDGEKTDGYRYVGGWAVDCNIAAYEMELLARLYHKWSGVRLRHWVITFEERELQAAEKRLPGLNRWQVLLQLAYELTAYYADRYQVVFAVHGDHGAGHLHVVMNTVSYVDGLKFSGSKSEYYAYQDYAKGVAARYGFHIYTVPDQTARKGIHHDE